MRWSITGTSASALARCWATALSVASGSNLRCSTSVEDSGSPSVKVAKTHEWNIGAAIIVVCRARSGIFENSAAAGSIESGCLRAAPLGVPVVPEVRITTRPFSAGAAPARDQRLQHRGRAGPARLGPGDEAFAALRARPHQLGELLVVDDGHGPLARQDVGDLRPREGGGEIQIGRA